MTGSAPKLPIAGRLTRFLRTAASSRAVAAAILGVTVLFLAGVAWVG